MCTSMSGKTASKTGMGLEAFGTGLSAFSSYSAAKAQNKANEYNAKALEQNAAYADAQAMDALDRGRDEAAQLGTEIAQLKGSQVAGYAGAGIDVTQGSAARTVEDTDRMGHLDMDTIMQNAGTEATAYRMQGANYRGEAKLKRASNSSPWLGAGTTLLTGASKLFTSYADWKDKYVLPTTGKKGP